VRLSTHVATVKTVLGKWDEYLKHLKAHAQRCLARRMLRSRRRSLHSCAAQYRHRGECRFAVADNVVRAVSLYRNWPPVVVTFHDRHMTSI